MAHSGQIITAPVVMPSDISAVLGNGGTDLGTNCRSSAINMWAKYKPVPYAKIDTTDEFDKSTNKWKSTATWWKNRIINGVDSGAYCGFVIPTMDVGSLTGGDPEAWTVKRPAGGANQPYRLTDFACYYHGAVCPFSVTLPTTAVWTGSAISGKVRVFRPSVHEYNLTLNDIMAGGTAYFGVAIIVGTSVYTKTQASTSEALISLEGCPLLRGTGINARIVVFMTSSPHTSWTNADYTIWSLAAPNISFSVAGNLTTVQAATDSYQIVLSGLIGTDKTALRMETAWLNNGVRSQARILRVPSHYYYLNSISLKVVRYSDGATMYTGSISISGAQQQAIELTSSDVGTYLSFYCSKGSYTPPTLSDPTDYYIWTYTFNYGV